MNVSTLHNSTLALEPQYKLTNYKTVSGKCIYIMTSYDGIQSFVTKGKTHVLHKPQNSKYHKFIKVPCWNHIDPMENEVLFIDYPERFSVYRKALLHEALQRHEQFANVTY